ILSGAIITGYIDEGDVLGHRRHIHHASGRRYLVRHNARQGIVFQTLLLRHCGLNPQSPSFFEIKQKKSRMACPAL
ncbi:MAG: hypothetical protein Q4F70_06500, partial [Clostridia bacterium]|nr:hypothetical protein [Clostridia bacterium]